MFREILPLLLLSLCLCLCHCLFVGHVSPCVGTCEDIQIPKETLWCSGKSSRPTGRVTRFTPPAARRDPRLFCASATTHFLPIFQVLYILRCIFHKSSICRRFCTSSAPIQFIIHPYNTVYYTSRFVYSTSPFWYQHILQLHYLSIFLPILLIFYFDPIQLSTHTDSDFSQHVMWNIFFRNAENILKYALKYSLYLEGKWKNQNSYWFKLFTTCHVKYLLSKCWETNRNSFRRLFLCLERRTVRTQTHMWGKHPKFCQQNSEDAKNIVQCMVCNLDVLKIAHLRIAHLRIAHLKIAHLRIAHLRIGNYI